MQKDKLDLVQFHWWDFSDRRYVDAAQALVQLQADGKIGHVAACNFDDGECLFELPSTPSPDTPTRRITVTEEELVRLARSPYEDALGVEADRVLAARGWRRPGRVGRSRSRSRRPARSEEGRG